MAFYNRITVLARPLSVALNIYLCSVSVSSEIETRHSSSVRFYFNVLFVVAFSNL